MIIDPELVYSSYLGGGDSDWGSALAGDGAGGVWVMGTTYSTDFPVTEGAYQSDYGCYQDLFISHFSTTGTLLSSTYLGGGGSDLGYALTGDDAGGVWVAGYTRSTDFPILNASQSTYEGDGDAFVVHFSSSGTLLSSTYLGGEGWDEGRALAGDGAGGVWVTGWTESFDFPIRNAYQNEYGGSTDAFVSHFSSTGTLLSSTYLGGEDQDWGYALTSDGAGGVWVVGATWSIDFPILNAHQDHSGGIGWGAFVAHFSSIGALLSSTALGTWYDSGTALAGDDAGGVWVTGWTTSNNFPVLEAYQSSFRGYLDAFVSHFSSTGTLLSSTYLGGEDWEKGLALAGDGAGGVWVAGSTISTDFPVLDGYQNNYGGGEYDAFVAHFSSTGTLLSSTYLGGGNLDWGCALAGDGAGGVWIVGETDSTDFPVQNASQSSCRGGKDVFIAHFSSIGTLLSSTYLGGRGDDVGTALVGDGAGGVWIMGETESDDFPTLNAYQNSHGGDYDAFLAKFSDPGCIPKQTRNLAVPYIHQVYDTPTNFNGEAACSETSAVMVLAYHGRLSPDPVVCEDKWVYGGIDESLDPPHVSVYGRHVCDEYTYNSTTFSKSFTDTTQLGRTATGAGAWGWIESAVNTGTERSEAIIDYLELHDCDAEFIRSPSSYEASTIIKENIDKGRPVIARTCPDGVTEHYVVITGYSQDSGGTSYFVNDPYGIEPYDDTISVQHLDQLVRYTYGQMRLGESSRGLITIHPFQDIQPEKIEGVPITTIPWDKEGSSVFADPLALSGDIEGMIAGEEGGDDYIRLRFEASGYIKNPSAVIVDKAGTPVSVPASNLKVEKTDDNNVIVYWDGKSGENTVNQANNPYNISITAEDKSGVTVTSEEARVWVGRPVLLVHGVTGEAEDVETRLVYKELSKEYYVEAVEYLPGIDNAFGSIPKYAECLDSEIKRIKEEKGAKRVDIVAHSMGGLISRWRIEEIRSGDGDVGKLIMMGTPNHGAEFAEKLMALVTFFESSMSYPDFAVNQMRPGKDFLKELNGGNSYWYDVYLYKYGLGKQDEIAENTQYYVLAGSHWLTFSENIPRSSEEKIDKKDKQIEKYRGYGDAVVPYYSAMIANPRATTYDMHYRHGEMWDKRDYYDKVVEILTKPDEDATSYSGASLYSDGGGEMYQSVLGHFASSEEENPSLTSLLTSIDVTINPEEKYYSEFEVNADTDSLSCFAFWESGRMEISLTDPDGNLAASETDEAMSLLSVSSPQGGVWNLSVSPIDIPASGTDLSLKIYITHPLYATVVDDMGTYAPGSPVPISVYAGSIDLPATGGTATCIVKTPDGETVTLDLHDDGAHDDEYPDDGIYGNTFTDTGTIGIYSLDISVSVPYGSEMVERKIEKTITINSYPDLVIRSGDLSASNTTPDAGDIITFSTIVENIGDARATNASVIILDLTKNTPDIIAETVFDLGAGGSVTVESEWKAEPGTHEITAQISPFAEFMESDYTNNADSITIITNDYPVEIISENVTFTGTEQTEISIWLTNQTDPGYYITTLLYNDTIISPSGITSDDLDIEILLDEGGEFKFNATATERQKGLLHIGNISIQRAGERDTGTNTTIIVQAYDSGGKPRGLFMVDRFVYLFLAHPEANFTANVRSGEAPLIVEFTDLSTGEEIIGRYWSFGDGTLSTETDPVHTYLKDGIYDVSLTVVNTAGPSVMTSSQYITVFTSSEPPVANFTANVTAGTVPLTVQFNDTSTGNPVEWLWFFGDGGESFDQNPVHTYESPGNYTVSLTATNAGRSNTETRVNYILVMALPPVANFTANTTAGTAPLTVQFNDTSTGEVITRSWSFGDGATSTNQNPVHTYTAPGNYTVNLTATNAGGSSTETRPDYITVTRVKGDFNGNGEVDIGDVSKVAWMVVGKEPADLAADFNGNGRVDIGDAAKIAYYFVGKIGEL